MSRSSKSLKNINGYTLESLIGAGGFGKIYLGYYDDDVSTKYAIKHIFISKRDNKYKNLVEDIDDEIDILRNISSGNNCNKYVSCIHDYFFIENNKEINYYIVMDYIKGVDLHSYMADVNFNNLPIETLILIALEMARGLEYIHQKNVAHNDVKPENIMISDEGQVIYIDFGLSCVSPCFLYENCHNLCGIKPVGITLLYVAPELLKSVKKSGDIDSKVELYKKQQIDMWSFGVVLYELFHNKSYPFGNYTGIYELYDNIVNKPLKSSSTNNQVIDYVIDNLLIRDTERLTSSEVRSLLESYVLNNIIK